MAYAFESSGELKQPTPEELAEADKQSAILVYSHGMAGDGRPYYAYVAIRPSKYTEFHAASAAGQSLLLSEYGTVVAGGFADRPPPDVVRRMREINGFDDDYEEKLAREVRDQRDAFLKQNENARLHSIVNWLKHTQS